MIEWNEGLNIGIKVLDDDHKKLLSIINNLSESLQRDDSKNTIQDIFIDLENYAQEHFTREEVYLDKHKCKMLESHQEQHRFFTSTLKDLKEKLLHSNNQSNTQEVIFFLVDWLFTHIIEEDIPIFKILATLKEKEERSFFKTIIKKVTDSFSFTKRLLYSAFVPLIGMLILGFIIIWNHYSEYENIKVTSNVSNIIFNISKLTHSLQIERGLSSAYLAKEDEEFKNSLIKQRNKFDASVEIFFNRLYAFDKKNILFISPNIKKFKQDTESLNSFRQKVISKQVSQTQAIQYYNDIIKNILNITSKISTLNLDAKLSSSISTLSSFSNYKEVLGLKRAYGIIICQMKNASTKEYLHFISLLGTLDAMLLNFEQTATITQKESLITYSKEIDILQKNIQLRNFKNLNSTLWFNAMTKLIDEMKIFEDYLLNDITTQISRSLDDNIRNLFLWFLAICIIFIITLIIIYIFTHSSNNELSRFTKAMKDLATGGRSFNLPVSDAQDEMSKMYNAYDKTRRKLLRGDIYTQLYLHQKDIEIKKGQKQNSKLEEMAYIDPLTGALNRRKFTELSSLEIERSIRYKSNLSFLMLDIDFFKKVNDTYGHAVGDEVLKHFSGICLEMARNLDIVARIGGEEFVVMLPETNSEGAYSFAERFREKIFNSQIVIQRNTIKYTVSIGIGILDHDIDKNIESILDKADKALYKAKESGRNTTIIYTN